MCHNNLVKPLKNDQVFKEKKNCILYMYTYRHTHKQIKPKRKNLTNRKPEENAR